MSGAKKSAPSGDVPPPNVAQTKPDIGFGHPEYSFVKSVSEMQNSLGRIDANLITLTKSVDGLKTKVEDLVGWKNKIFGFIACLVLIGGVIGWAAKTFSEYVTFKTPGEHAQPQTQPQASPAPASVKPTGQ